MRFPPWQGLSPDEYEYYYEDAASEEKAEKKGEKAEGAAKR